MPRGFVLTTEAFAMHVDHHRRAEGAKDEAIIHAQLETLPLAPKVAGALREGVAHLSGAVAVRSSGVAEDGAHGSHAGQFHTTLGVVGIEALEAAVRTCWASAFTERVRQYQARRLGRVHRLGVAVVVQEMVAARVGGVVFTINPVSGDWGEMTVEAALGLGTMVVDGQILPDFYRVSRPRRVWPGLRRIGLRLQVRERSREINPQPTMTRLRPSGGLETVPVSAKTASTAKLTSSDLQKLCRLALRAEELEGAPVDVEWAQGPDGRFYLLQARAITAGHEPTRGGEVVWTRRFLGERWTEPATPLGWSLVRRELEWLIDYPETSRLYLGAAPPTRLYRAAPYLNATVFRHLAFKIPGAPPPRFMVELLPPAEEAGWLTRRAAAPDWHVYASILRATVREQRWKRFRWNPLRNWAHWESFERTLPSMLEDLPPRHQPRARAEAVQALVRLYVKIHVCSLLFANIGFELASARLSSAGCGELADQVLRPLSPSATVRANQALWLMGNGKLGLETLLADHGRRSPSSWELFSPRWQEEPQSVEALARAAAIGPSPLETAQRRIDVADLAMNQVPAALRGFVRLVRRYLQLREDQRHTFEQITWEWKQAWLALEARTELELRFLDVDEADGVLARRMDHSAAADLIARRQREHEAEILRWNSGDEPPVFLGGQPLPEQMGRRLRGRGISRGVARGPVRVVQRLEEAHALRPGEVLVARATDPGWTPLFRTASALILEQGGMLSHGAVVAREYGLPGVVNVVNVTRRLRTGQRVTVDGARGLVLID